ncbi:MAG TPA: hypothetical protein VL202_19160 [Pararhizobium sp.]|uniref:hypothetical protein n=1 Tax=Pararhizobium sp. TaxID=1977563 RepID=UPI002B6D75EF|nr:hypothetical protein [Pararhizobium sp.]HTO33272.1 hypothetical protein [Pararhizobium sp.]
MSMENPEYRRQLEEEREQLKNVLANEFKFFSATNDFRDGMLPGIISLMRRYDSIERVLKRYQADEARPDVEPPVVIGRPPVEGDTLHFVGNASPRK